MFYFPANCSQHFGFPTLRVTAMPQPPFIPWDLKLRVSCSSGGREKYLLQMILRGNNKEGLITNFQSDMDICKLYPMWYTDMTLIVGHKIKYWIARGFEDYLEKLLFLWNKDFVSHEHLHPVIRSAIFFFFSRKK